MKIEAFLKGNKTKLILLIATIILFVLPFTNDNNYLTSIFITFFAFAAMGASWNIIGGYAAQISWCHASFVAIGGYTSILMLQYFNTTPFISIFIGMAISVFFAFIIGSASFRLRGAFFTLSTIAFAEIIRVLLLYFKNFTGGANGLYIAYKGNNLWNLQFSNDKPHYYIMFLMMVIIIFVANLLQKSKMGYYLRAIKSDEDAAQSLGIGTHKVKLKAFMISAALTSAIGSIYAFFVAYIDPTSIAGLELSVKIGTVAIIGGLATIWGPVIGAFVIVLLTEMTNLYLGFIPGAAYMIYGLVLILIVLFRPAGLISLFNKKNKNKPRNQKDKIVRCRSIK